MEVTGITAARAKEIEDASIIGGTVDASGNLKLTNKAGATFNAGKVVVPLAAYPVGSIYIHTTNAHPSTLLGGGEWSRFGQGRVLVGVDEGDAAFDTVLETGGAKAVALTDPLMNAPHTHGVTDSGHVHSGGAYDPAFGGVAGEANFAGPGVDTGLALTGISVNSSGGGMPHNNLQPYITVYMWRRTA